MFGMKKSKSDEKKTYVMLVNCGWGFLNFEDDDHAIYENKFTGMRIRFRISDATYEPIGA